MSGQSHNRFQSCGRALVMTLCLFAVTSTLRATNVPAYIVAKAGDSHGGTTISTLNSPFTSGTGKVGFVASLADNRRMIWFDTGPVFYSDSALPLSLTGHESTMGVSDAGGFIYSPSVDGNDAVYTHNGVLLKRTDPAPGFSGQFNSFNSRPHMTADGTAWWIAGVANTPTGSSVNRVLYRANGANPLNITKVLAGGDVIGGFTISTGASNFDFDISDDNNHHIHILDTTAPSSSNTFVYVDGVMAHQEGAATGAGENWTTFDTPGINLLGNYIFSADTNNPNTGIDAVLVYNGLIAVREGMTLGGHTLTSAVTAASINNLNQVAFIWGGTGNEALFLGDGPNLAASASLLLKVGDTIDIDNDTVPDWQVFDFKASGAIGPGLDLAGDGYVYVEVGIGPVGGSETMEAVLRLTPEPMTASLLLLGSMLVRRRRMTRSFA